MMTPFDKLKSLPDATTFLKPGVTFDDLSTVAYAIRDKDATRALNRFGINSSGPSPKLAAPEV